TKRKVQPMTLTNLTAVPTDDTASSAEHDLMGDRSDKKQSSAKDTVFFRPTASISVGQTLVTLAEQLFHDANLGWLIADLNCDHGREYWMDGKRIIELRSRQKLVLPVWQDILSFYSQRPPHSRPENLITVVVQTEIDRHALQGFLGRVIHQPRSTQGSASGQAVQGR